MSLHIKQTLFAKENKTKVFIKYLVILTVIIGLIALFYYYRSIPPKIHYTTTTPTLQNISSTISATGTLTPTNEVNLGSVVSGIVLEVSVEVNDRVKKGQILARIDPESINQQLDRYRAQLQSARAQLQSAKASLNAKEWEYKKLKELYEKSGGKTPSILELETSKSAYLVALAEIEVREASILEIETNIKSSEIDLKNTKIISPIDGVVLSRSIAVGESVAASFQAPEFFIIAESLEEMELKVNVSEADIGKVKEGQRVSFSVDAYPNRTFEAVVNRVSYGSNAYDTTSSSTTTTSGNIVSYETKIAVKNPDLALKPGMSATADIEVANAKEVLSVPLGALYFNPQALATTTENSKGFSLFGPPPRPRAQQSSTQKTTQDKGTLWILERGVPKKLEVAVGISDGKNTQILSDNLTQDEQVILSQTVDG